MISSAVKHIGLVNMHFLSDGGALKRRQGPGKPPPPHSDGPED